MTGGNTAGIGGLEGWGGELDDKTVGLTSDAFFLPSSFPDSLSAFFEAFLAADGDVALWHRKRFCRRM